jgi:hypothetical protein
MDTLVGEFSKPETECAFRTTEQAQGGKAVGVDPSLITACKCELS